jgi:hypothetical protein
VQSCNKYCVEGGDPNWAIDVDLTWGTRLSPLPIAMQAHDSASLPDTTRDAARGDASPVPTSAVLPSTADTSTSDGYFRSLGDGFARVLAESATAGAGANARTGISALPPLSLAPVDAPADLYAHRPPPSTNSSPWGRLNLESEAGYSGAGSDTAHVLPSIKECGLLDWGEGGALPAPPVFGLMAGQQQQAASASSPAARLATRGRAPRGLPWLEDSASEGRGAR